MSKKEKIIRILGLVFIAQIILILLFIFFSNKSLTNRAIGKSLLNGFKKENVIAIEINDYKDTFSIEKTNNSWFVKTNNRTMPGDKSKIDTYLNILADLKAGIVMEKNSNDETDKVYGFGRETYQKVTVKLNNKKTFSILIGNASKQQGYSYIKYKDNKIREVKSRISTDTSNQAVLWSKKDLFDNITLEDIDKCQITSNLPWYKGSYFLKTNPDKKPDSQNVDSFVFEPKIEGKLVQYAAENIVRNMILLKIDDYKFGIDVAGREKLATINLTLKNGKSYNFFIYKSDKGDITDYLLKDDFNSYLYLVSETSLKKIVKAREDLLEKPENK